MARWKLREAHYLLVEDCYWEQVETDRESGRQKRKQYPVPMHLDPNNPGDCNYRPASGNVLIGGQSEEMGSIVVCLKGKGQPKDYVMLSDPTPGMEPIDDEAREISDSLSHKWVRPNENELRTLGEIRLDEAVGLMGKQATRNYDDELIGMQKQVMDMMGMMANVMQQNQKLLEQMAAPARRV